MNAASSEASSYYTFCAYLLTLFSVGVVVYVGGFAAYNYKYKELRGMEMLPHRLSCFLSLFTVFHRHDDDLKYGRIFVLNE